MIIILEGLVMCFLLLITCVIGISNGPAGLAVLYEKDVQERVVELGLTTKRKLKKTFIITCIVLFAPQFILVPLMVYGINGVTGFWSGFWQMTAILMIQGIFDRIFIDWYWVEHTKAWEIEGTADLKPYIPLKIKLGKWASTLIVNPAIAAIIAGVMEWIL